jgi:hypothetical protein
LEVFDELRAFDSAGSLREAEMLLIFLAINMLDIL